ncbi:MAG: PEP-CTERM sorting domain-containing protein [Gemmatales bacterium]
MGKSVRFMQASLIAASLLFSNAVQAQITVRSGSANDIAGITPVHDQFRNDLGGGTTAGANGLFDDGVFQRREINWDGVPAGFSAPNLLSANFFNVNSPRGAVFSTSGTGFMVSGANTDAGAGQPAAANFGNIDPTYTSTFSPFSAQRLFTAVGSNQLDVTFFVPGTNVRAGVRGFGVVFSDVEQAGTTAIQFFDPNGVSLGAFAASPAASGGFSFLGAFINDGSSIIGSVRITNGNSALGAGITDSPGSPNFRDLVVMDDFIYGNPVAVPEPATLCLIGAGLLGSGIVVQRKYLKRRRRSRTKHSASVPTTS